jgi:hypothetical protein
VTEPGESGRTPLDRSACIPPADRAFLAEHVPDHVIEEAASFLARLPDAKRPEFLAELRHAAPRYKKRALVMALANVNHNTEQAGASHSQEPQP